MSEIHYFPRYSQPENQVTNNTLLFLLRLREFSRYKFERFMELLSGDQDVQLASSWLRFQQQKGTGKSVVDGYIAQESVKIAVETKLGGTFNPDQLENHLAVFGNEQHKLLILLSPSLNAEALSQLAAVRQRIGQRNIQIIHTSFEDIVENCRRCLSPHDEEMIALVDDYEAFCSDIDLLPRDNYTMFVPPCSQSFTDNMKYRLYYCPVEWNRRQSRYLGVYKDRAVRAVGVIDKVVACTVDVNNQVVIPLPESRDTLTDDEKKRIIGATVDATARDWQIESGHKFYLCNELRETCFSKTSPGGIMGHRYFDLEKELGSKVPNTLEGLATELKQRKWE